MRWFLIPLILATVAAVAYAANPPRAPGGCTWTGTSIRDVKTGSAGPDVLCALPGNDFVHGGPGADVIKAGAGRDTVVGGGGKDIVRGGGARDRLFAVDDHPGDTVAGGTGIDQCFVDPGDKVRGCERTFRSNEPEMATALGSSLMTVMGIVEESPTVTVSPPVTVTNTTTQTVTKTASFPPCSPPPPTTPSPC